MSANTSVIRPTAVRLGSSRILAVTGATLAAVAVWAVEARFLGIHLAAQFGNAVPIGVGFDAVIVSALVGSLAGWGFLVLLEWRTSSPRTIWTGVAIAALLASLALPLVAGTTMSAKLGLAFMHLAVGGVLIPGLRRI